MPTAAVQYLRGLEPDSVKRISEALAKFKFETKFKKENSIRVDELDRYRRSKEKTAERKHLAHRYRIVVTLGDSQLELPRNHGRFYTADEVIACLDDLAALWVFIRDYRVKKAIEHKAKISQLNHAAAVSEKEISKW